MTFAPFRTRYIHLYYTFNMVQARQAVLSLLPALLATQAAAQYFTTTQSNSVSAQTTVNLFLGAGASGAGFAGTVVNADSCGSTIGIACTSGGYSNSGTSGFCIATDTVRSHNARVWIDLGLHADSFHRLLGPT